MKDYFVLVGLKVGAALGEFGSGILVGGMGVLGALLQL